MINGEDIDEVMYKVCKKLKNAKEYSPRGQRQKS